MHVHTDIYPDRNTKLGHYILACPRLDHISLLAGQNVGYHRAFTENAAVSWHGAVM